MALFKLIFRNVFRHKLRSALTVVGIAIAISAFGLIRTVIAAWYVGVEASAPNRLITRNAVSLLFLLPSSYRDSIEAVPGVARVTFASWFGGVYIDERHSQFPQFAIDASSWFDLYPEFLIPDDQKEAFLRERNAAVVGANLAKRFGWKIGDTIRMHGTFYPGDWDFVIRGVYKGRERSTDQTQFFFHWKYLDERLRQMNSFAAGQVGWYVIKVADPQQAGVVSQAVDRRFKNSLAETLTETEKAFVLGFVSMSETILTALRIISLVIIGVILAVLSNTMSMTARERLSEYAVLKTLGFGARHLVLLIVAESLMIASAGGLFGIALTFPAAIGFGRAMSNAMGAFFPVKVVPETLAICGLIAVGVGLAAALFPAGRAVTVRIADGLRRVG